MTTYTDNFGAQTQYYNVKAIVIPAAGSVRVPAGAVEIDKPVDMTKSGDVWSSTTGGLLTFYDTEQHDQTDAPGGTLTANTVDQSAL